MSGRLIKIKRKYNKLDLINPPTGERQNEKKKNKIQN